MESLGTCEELASRQRKDRINLFLGPTHIIISTTPLVPCHQKYSTKELLVSMSRTWFTIQQGFNSKFNEFLTGFSSHQSQESLIQHSSQQSLTRPHVRLMPLIDIFDVVFSHPFKARQRLLLEISATDMILIRTFPTHISIFQARKKRKYMFLHLSNPMG